MSHKYALRLLTLELKVWRNSGHFNFNIITFFLRLM